jgi:hypothetical protein
MKPRRVLWLIALAVLGRGGYRGIQLGGNSIQLTPTFRLGAYMIRVEYKAADKWIGLYDPPAYPVGGGEVWARDWWLVIRPQYPIHIRRVYP